MVGQVAITLVLVLSAATAILALRSTVERDERVIRIDQRLAELEGLRAQVRELARASRRYLLTGDVSERQRAKELSDRIRTARTGAIALSRHLGDFALAAQASLTDDRRDPGTIQRFETSLQLVRGPLADAFHDEIQPLLAQRDASRSSRSLATGAQWGLAIAAALGLGLGIASMLLIRRLLRDVARRATAVERQGERATRCQRELVDAGDHLCKSLQVIAERAVKLRALSTTSLEQRGLDSISDVAAKLEARVRQLLDVTEIQAGNVTIVRELFSVGPVIDHVLRQYARVAADRGVCVHAEPPGSLSIVADRDRIGFVIGAHLEQAIELAHSGAEIVVTVISTDDGVRFAFLQPRLVPGIDRPPTISEDDLSSTLCRTIVEAHGGRMGIDVTALGHTRWFTLPSQPRLLR